MRLFRDLLGKFGPILLIVIVCFFFIYLLLIDSKKTYERNIKTLYQIKCGALINTINYSAQLVRFSIYDDFIVLRAIKTYRIMTSNIHGYSIVGGISSKGINLNHDQDGIPKNITIWTSSIDEITNVLDEVINK